MTQKEDGFAPATGDMNAAEFRRFGHELIDWVSDYFERIEELPVLSQIEPGDLKAALPTKPPASGESMAEIIADVDRLIVPALTNWSHPSFFAFFATSTSAPGIFGELLSAAFDNKAMLWRTSPASTELEEVTLDWLRQMMGLDSGYSGIIYDTASVSSMHAMAAAREGVEQRVREMGMSGRPDLPLLRVYVSEHSHSSIEKGVIALGLGQRGIRKIPTDSEFRMNVSELKRAIDEDKSNGYIPFCIVATVGTTSTSSIDPIKEIVPIGEAEAMWLHVDAAYAGSAAVVPELRYILDGCERADSVVVNPHKWLFTPFDLSVLYCRHMDLLRRAFTLDLPEYLKTPEQERVRSGSDYGIQLGRRFRALKLWMIIRYFGHEGLAARIREHCRLAKLFASWVNQAEEWELLAPVPLGLVCFRACPRVTGDDALLNKRLDVLNEAILHSVNSSGKALLSHTRLHDKLTLRLSIGNIRTTEKQVRQVWELLNNELVKLK